MTIPADGPLRRLSVKHPVNRFSWPYPKTRCFDAVLRPGRVATLFISIFAAFLGMAITVRFRSQLQQCAVCASPVAPGVCMVRAALHRMAAVKPHAFPRCRAASVPWVPMASLSRVHHSDPPPACRIPADSRRRAGMPGPVLEDCRNTPPCNAAAPGRRERHQRRKH